MNVNFFSKKKAVLITFLITILLLSTSVSISSITNKNNMNIIEKIMEYQSIKEDNLDISNMLNTHFQDDNISIDNLFSLIEKKSEEFNNKNLKFRINIIKKYLEKHLIIKQSDEYINLLNKYFNDLTYQDLDYLLNNNKFNFNKYFKILSDKYQIDNNVKQILLKHYINNNKNKILQNEFGNFWNTYENAKKLWGLFGATNMDGFVRGVKGFGLLTIAANSLCVAGAKWLKNNGYVELAFLLYTIALVIDLAYSSIVALGFIIWENLESYKVDILIHLTMMDDTGITNPPPESYPNVLLRNVEVAENYKDEIEKFTYPLGRAINPDEDGWYSIFGWWVGPLPEQEKLKTYPPPGRWEIIFDNEYYYLYDIESAENRTEPIRSNDVYVWHLKLDTNPNMPSEAPIGPIELHVDEIGEFISSALDPDGHKISIQFDWGNGIESKWSDLTLSGQPISMNYSWNNKGCYIVKARSRDQTERIESCWSEGLKVYIYE